jgi:fido (protein-threonine AMPylation protein)
VAESRGRPSREQVYARFDAEVAELWDRLGGLPGPLEADGIWRHIWIDEAHHSTALEGNTLVLRQVEALLAEGKAVGNKELKEYLEVRGYADAATWVYQQATTTTDELVSITEIRHVHRLAMTPVWDVASHPVATDKEGPGSFRQHDIQPFPEGMVPPSWVYVEAELAAWVAEANDLEARSPRFPEVIAKLHRDFEQIHPFLDGNGRTGRLLLNLLLVRLGYPPAIIYKRDRGRYLKALRRADQGECANLGEFLARAILDNLHRFIVPAVAGPARIVPLAALASKKINANALRTAALRGRLQAVRGSDGQWRSSKNWVDEYLKARYVRRK